MADLPRFVTIHEEGPREGFQSEARVFPTKDKLRLIHALAGTGLRDIQCTSFVNPERVPQMADAQELSAGIERRPGVRYTGLWLNRQGFERSMQSGLDARTSVITSASTTFSVKNNGCGSAELTQRQGRMVQAYRDAGLPVDVAYVFAAFGCHYEGKVTPARAVVAASALLDVCAEHGAAPRLLYFCDTVGVANPAQVEALLGEARSRWPGQEFALHLHDTRGMGLANALAGLKLGVSHFDASCGGLGGCPFAGAKDAPGNVCTEDLAFMCEEMGIETGIDLEALCDCTRLAESILGRSLPGRLVRSGYGAAW
ncbi:hydroxymethylglutaryl-CoA lyase [Variovorax sp. M-6]|uniref:hydroxymethylglutaryl-CoA lyase n=1 Tax=Variovorax sp. M-6 TaxID=3233041 RepID=UPI003F9C2D08